MTEQTVQARCSASSRWKSSVNVNFQCADDSQTNHGGRNRQEQHWPQTGASWNTVVGTWRHLRGSGQSIVGTASRWTNWSTRMRRWRSLSDSCWCRGAKQPGLSGAAGFFVFSLVSDYRSVWRSVLHSLKQGCGETHGPVCERMLRCEKHTVLTV